jgi:serine/threonine protein kinase
MRESAQPSGPKKVASYHEFAAALVQLGLIDGAELERFAADAAQGVLGLSRALVQAGKLTSYQAAAVYQKKSRGLLIGNYLILDKLGQGGMGMVFKARHRTLGRTGALKILPPSFTRDRAVVMRFRREFEAAGRLKHVNLVAAREANEDRGVHYLVMEYVRGITLDRVVCEHGPLRVDEAVDYVIQAARGLEAAHEKGIVHRDIKPGNLMLDRQGTIRVLDLGLARIINPGNAFDSDVASRLTQSGIYMGTIDYMAPEQGEDSHNVDHRADIYSLGCTFYFLLTGREPFPAPTRLRRMVAHQDHPAPSLRTERTDIPPALDAAYRRMMAKRPGDRPASMSEVISLLHASRPSRDDDTRPVATSPEPSLSKLVTDPGQAERRDPPRKTIDSTIFARRAAEDDRLGGHELNLRDLVMDVRSDGYGTGEVCTKRDESEWTCGDNQLSLRELALELGEGAAPAGGPKPPGTAAQPLKPTVRKEDDAPPQAPLPCAAAEHKDAPPAGLQLSAANPQHLKPAAPLPAGGSPPNKLVAIFAVVAVILLLMLAVVVSIGDRSTAAKDDESSTPAVNAVESANSTHAAPAPPL